MSQKSRLNQDLFGNGRRSIEIDTTNYQSRAPRDLFLAFHGAGNILCNIYALLRNTSNFIESVRKGDNPDDTLNYSRLGVSFVKLAALNHRRLDNNRKALEHEKAYAALEERFGAVAGEPILFCGTYFPSFYDLTYGFTAACVSPLYDKLWSHTNSEVDWLVMWESLCATDSWKKPMSLIEGYPETEVATHKELNQIFDSIAESFIGIRDKLYEGLQNASSSDMEALENRFIKAMHELSPGFASIQTQFFKAWKTLPWPDGYETLSDRPFTQKEKDDLNLGGRPRKYDDLLETFQEGEWKDEKQYYDFLCERDDSAVKNHQAETISFRAFKKGLDDARARTKPDE